VAKIVLNQVSVDFPIYGANGRSLKNIAFSALTGGRIARGAHNVRVVRALDGITAEFNDGDRIGLAGPNGSGKSTLLRVIAGVYEPSSGYVDIQGRLISMLSITQGMNSELTGFENIGLRASLLGLNRKQTKLITDEIIEFSDLGEFIKLPLRTYSSGMAMRLAFSIATSIDADILVMDEWLSVGDAEFSEKAKIRLDTMVNKASILVIASHNPDLINSVCNKKYALEHGKMSRMPDPVTASTVPHVQVV
jgi:lipopolysaccharide transport system ATP-binding protein